MNASSSKNLEKAVQESETVNVSPSPELTYSKVLKKKMGNLGIEEKKDTIKWRSKFSEFMMIFLLVQYLVIVTFLALQGFNLWGFNLDNYIFYILVGGTLVQSYLLVRIIFQYLFSKKIRP